MGGGIENDCPTWRGALEGNDCTPSEVAVKATAKFGGVSGDAILAVGMEVDFVVEHQLRRAALCQELRSGGGNYVQSVGAQKVHSIRERIQSYGARVLSAPPCSADLNPIRKDMVQIHAIFASSARILRLKRTVSCGSQNLETSSPACRLRCQGNSRPRTPPKITASITTSQVLTQPTETC